MSGTKGGSGVKGGGYGVIGGGGDGDACAPVQPGQNVTPNPVEVCSDIIQPSQQDGGTIAGGISGAIAGGVTGGSYSIGGQGDAQVSCQGGCPKGGQGGFGGGAKK